MADLPMSNDEVDRAVRYWRRECKSLETRMSNLREKWPKFPSGLPVNQEDVDNLYRIFVDAETTRRDK